MNDSLLVCRFKRFADVFGDIEYFFTSNRSTPHTLSQVLPFDEFEN